MTRETRGRPAATRVAHRCRRSPRRRTPRRGGGRRHRPDQRAVSVFVNSYGVHAVTAPAVYTTAKNLVATVVLVGAVSAPVVHAPAARLRRRPIRLGPDRRTGRQRPSGPGRRPPVRGDGRSCGGSVWPTSGIVGGGIAFVLFFDGLADTTATPAAFIRDTLVIWVAVLAVPSCTSGSRGGTWPPSPSWWSVRWW